MDIASLLIQILNAVQYGLLLFLVASGLTLVFGIMGIINLAHGSFYMLGAYLAFVLTGSTGSLLLSIALGMLFLRQPNYAAGTVEHHETCAACALVKRADIFRQYRPPWLTQVAP